MRHTWKITALAATLALALCACAPAASAPPDTPGPETAPVSNHVSTPAPATAPPEETPESPFGPLPVTEEAIRDCYAAEGYYTVESVTPYEGDFLVELSDGGDCTLLFWIFGQTGRRVQLNAMEYMTSYRILDRGRVEISTDGVSAMTPWKGLPRTYTVYTPSDESDIPFTDEPTAWLDPAEPLYVGWWERGPAPGIDRYEQLYDARIDADGLSFAFIPNGDSTEKFQSFFPACTTIPSFQTGFDPDTRRFTLRLYHVSLESGGVTGEDLDWIGDGTYDGLYPCSFPEGSLGRDSHFLTDVEVRADGEDTVVTAVLTERAFRFTVESSNLGYDSIPSFRLVFREESPDLDE